MSALFHYEFFFLLLFLFGWLSFPQFDMCAHDDASVSKQAGCEHGCTPPSQRITFAHIIVHTPIWLRLHFIDSFSFIITYCVCRVVFRSCHLYDMSEMTMTTSNKTNLNSVSISGPGIITTFPTDTNTHTHTHNMNEIGTFCVQKGSYFDGAHDWFSVNQLTLVFCGHPIQLSVISSFIRFAVRHMDTAMDRLEHLSDMFLFECGNFE